MSLKKGDQGEVTVTSLTSKGEGVGRYSGFTLFIEGALPGETVLFEITEAKKRFARAALKKVLAASPNRTSPPCPLFGTCGGCQLMHLSYSGQLTAKRERVMDAFKRIGGFEDLQVEKCLPSPKELHYRNKVQFPVVLNQGQKVLGLYAAKSHQVIPVETCYLQSHLGNTTYQTLKKLIQDSSITPFSHKTGKGTLKQLVIKTAEQTNQVLIVLVTTGREPEKTLELATAIQKNCSEVVGVVENRGKITKTLTGKPVLTESLSELLFQISGTAFFQVNPLQANHLYTQALEFADLTPKSSLLDAYCGVGTLSLIASKTAEHVYGIETVPDAVMDANRNKKLNKIHNCTFYTGKVEELIDSIPGVDRALINPPRAGCDIKVLEALSRRSMEKIVYISCDPATLARDCQILTQKGYSIAKIQPVDMFPQTMHVECIVQLVKV